MDLPPWVNSAGDSPADPDAEMRRRLAAIENGIAALGERVDALATTLEQSVRDAVVQDVEAVAADLRHTVSDLGRLLVRDLGRLSKILAEHRDTIVAEVRGQPSPAAASTSTATAPAGPSKTAPTSAPSAPPVTSVEAMLAEVDGPEVSSIPVADGSEASGGGGGTAEQESGGWRGNRRRRRDS
jgi:hypothetical protein